MADIENLHPEFRRRIERACQLTGASVFSGARSTQRQKELFQMFQDGTGNPANPPGNSWHEYGDGLSGGTFALAVDFATDGPLNEVRARAKELQLCFPVASEVWHCVDADTEILTADGWKAYLDVEVGQEALTINPVTMLGEWQPISAVVRLPAADRKMLSMEGQAHSSLTTAEHRWITERQRYASGLSSQEKQMMRPVGRETTFCTSGEGFLADDRIPLAVPLVGTPQVQKYLDPLVELVAWYTTKGTDHNASQVIIYRSLSINPDHCARIRAALTDTFGPAVASLRPGRYLTEPAWREDAIERRRGRAATVEVDGYFTLNSAAGAVLRGLAPRRVPFVDFLRALTPAQLRLFLDVSILADGHERGTRRSISHARKPPLDRLQMVCALLGIPSHLRERSPRRWVLSLLSVVSAFPADFEREWVDHDGPVWCVTTANSTWLARRHGTTYFTGNCQPIEVPVSARAAGVEKLLPVPATASMAATLDVLTLPTEFTYIFGGTDWLWLGAERIHTRCTSPEVLEGLKKAKQVVGLGPQNRAFHDYLSSLATNGAFVQG